MLKSYGVGGWVGVWVVVYLDYFDSSGPCFSYEIEIEQGPELDNYWLILTIRKSLFVFFRAFLYEYNTV